MARADAADVPLWAAVRRAAQLRVAAGREPTDEAQAMEWQGGRPLLVAAQDSNIKITSRQDLALATAILRRARLARAQAATESAG